MRLKWIAFTFLLGLIVILDPTQTPAQPGGGKGGRKGNFGGGDANPGGGRGGPGGGYPGAGGGRNPGGNAPMMAPGGMPPGGGMQPGGPGGGRGGGGGGGGMFRTPEAMWTVLQGYTTSTGDTADLGRLEPSRLEFLNGRLAAMGALPIPPNGGVITRDQFLASFTQAPPMRPMGGFGPPGQPQWGNQWPNNNNMGPGPDNGDGSGDKNNGDKKDRAGRDRNKKEEEPKPIALRYGHLPDSMRDKLPEWFESYDVDKDGQIALWEWRRAGETIAAFEVYDLNKDGFITPDEFVRYEFKVADDRRIAALQDGERLPPNPSKAGKNGPGANRAGRSGPDAEKVIEGEETTPEKPANEKPAMKERGPGGPGPGSGGSNNRGGPNSGGGGRGAGGQPGKGPRNAGGSDSNDSTNSGAAERPTKGPNRGGTSPQPRGQRSDPKE